MTAVLEFHQVPMGQDGRQHLSLEVPEHATVAVLGPGNAGVDRLAGWALGLDPLPAGTVRLLGTDMAALPPENLLSFRRLVGYLPAGGGLLQNLSLRDNIALPLRFASRARRREIEGRIEILVAAVRLQSVADRRPAEVSEEDQRRAGVARAVALDPELVLLEHPFEVLSFAAAAELFEFARGGQIVEGSRRAVLVAAHDLPEALSRRFDRVHRLDQGAGEMAPRQS